MKKILLISPASENEALWITGTEGSEVKNNAPPLALLTIAAMTSDGVDVEIWDEVVHGAIDDNTIFEKEYDLVGVTGYKAHFQRCRQLADIFRKRNVLVVVGGPGVSATPDEYQDFFDILFIGEAERTWPQFLEDWLQGNHKSEYRQIESIEMSESPVPYWELIANDTHKYSQGSIQTTRGCPFDCEFCDVVYLFGRRPRHKQISTVIDEVKLLERLGFRSIFFCDDEFIGDISYAKDLLRALTTLNATFKAPLTFSTQLTLRVSKDDELLELLADANFDLLFIGIETPNQDSLRESGKLHNLGSNMVGNVHKIQSYGIVVRAGIIVGFDHDDTSIFDTQYEFIRDSFIPSVAINMLKAPFGTRLWSRLRQEGRVVRVTPEIRGKLGHPRSYTTIIPQQMTRVELMQGYRGLVDRVFSWPAFASRVIGFINNLRRVPATMRVVPAKELYASYPEKYGKDEDVRRIIDTILTEAIKKAPAMLHRIAALIVQHAKYREDIVKLLPQIDRQIAMETSEEIVFAEDKRSIPVPDSFRKAYRDIFPDLYSRVVPLVNDISKVPEVLVRVFVDFLSGFGADFKELTQEHLTYLHKSIEQISTEIKSEVVFTSKANFSQPTVPKQKVIYLGDDIMRSVNQILVNQASALSNQNTHK